MLGEGRVTVGEAHQCASDGPLKVCITQWRRSQVWSRGGFSGSPGVIQHEEVWVADLGDRIALQERRQFSRTCRVHLEPDKACTCVACETHPFSQITTVICNLLDADACLARAILLIV